MADASVPMMLRVLTPAGTAAETGCESVVFSIPDDAKGRGGGLVGIQRDHAPAVFAVAGGLVRATLRGRDVLLLTVSGGFASVKDNVVTVLTDSAVIEE